MGPIISSPRGSNTSQNLVSSSPRFLKPCFEPLRNALTLRNSKKVVFARCQLLRIGLPLATNRNVSQTGSRNMKRETLHFAQVSYAGSPTPLIRIFNIFLSEMLGNV